MAGRIEVTMESTYRGDLSKRLREDKQKLDAFQKWLDRSPLRVPVTLDCWWLALSGGHDSMPNRGSRRSRAGTNCFP